jgi:sugar transferase EpsL
MPAIKRSFDLILTIPTLIVLLPFLILLAAIILIHFGPPILFRQMRPGQHGKPFWLLKFRTMTDSRDENGDFLLDAERLTRFGRFLRSTSLDELPELFNIFKGDMSFVGPRPLLMQYLDRYTPEQARRHEVKPGLTGWAQVNGRNSITWEEKFKLDLWYVEHWSFILDLRIIFMTIVKVFNREGINQEGQATMGEFLGPNSQNSKGQ